MLLGTQSGIHDLLLLKTIQFCDESGELSYALVVRKLLLIRRIGIGIYGNLYWVCR